MYIASLCMWFKSHTDWMCNVIQELRLYNFKLVYKIAEATKNIFYAKGENAVDHSIVIKCLKKFWSGCKILKQGLVGLKPLISRPCSKSKRQICRVTLWEHQVTSSSHSSVWFITFMASAKASGAAELCLTMLKYFKTFDSPYYFS